MITLVLGGLMILALIGAKENRNANRILAVVLVCVLYRYWVLHWKITGALEISPWIFRSTFPTELLAPALFYLYVKAMTDKAFHFGRQHFQHLLPFFFGVLWFWFLVVNNFSELAFSSERFARLVVKELIAIPYLIAIFRNLLRFENETRNYVSDTSKIQIHWLRLLVASALILTMIDTADLLSGASLPYWTPVTTFTCIVMIGLSFFSLRYSLAFAKELQFERQESENTGLRISENMLQQYSTQLTEYLRNERAYLKPELRLSDLANALSIKPYMVSEVINKGLGTNFFDLINGYRVEAAKVIIKDPKFSHLNLMGVGLESGFNSKSVFNEVFKKRTQMTPSQFRSQTIL